MASLKKYLHRLGIRRHRRKIQRALALHLRGEARSDGLTLLQARNRLEIQWWARDIHPWDRDSPAESRSLMLFEQSLADTEAAVSRLFDALPEIDVIDLAVMDSTTVILAGTVHRATLEKCRQLSSLRMRLGELGINYRLVGSRLEPLESAY